MTRITGRQPHLFTGPVTMPGGATVDPAGNDTVPGDQVVGGDETVNGNSNPKGKVINESHYLLGPFTVASVPDPTINAGAVIYVSDGFDGDPTPAFSDGTNWLRWSDRLPIAGAALPSGADSFVDFQNNIVNIDGTPYTMASVLSSTDAIDANGLNFSNSSASIALAGALLTKVLTRDYVMVIEFFDTGYTGEAQLLMVADSSPGGASTDFFIIYRQSSGGAFATEMDEYDDASGDYRSQGPGASARPAVNRLGLAMNNSNFLGYLNGVGPGTEFGQQAYTTAVPNFTVAALGGHHAGTAPHDLKIRSLTFYPFTAVDATLETYTTVP